MQVYVKQDVHNNLWLTCTERGVVCAAVGETSTWPVAVAGPVTVKGMVAVHSLSNTSRTWYINLFITCSIQMEKVFFEITLVWKPNSFKNCKHYHYFFEQTILFVLFRTLCAVYTMAKFFFNICSLRKVPVWPTSTAAATLCAEVDLEWKFMKCSHVNSCVNLLS